MKCSLKKLNLAKKTLYKIIGRKHVNIVEPGIIKKVLHLSFFSGSMNRE